MLFNCSFVFESVSQTKNKLNSRINTTGLFHRQPPPSLDGGLESLKYDILFFSNFNCLTKALILRHLYHMERLYNCALLFMSKTLLNAKTGSTPQDALASIIALAVISLFESILYSVNSLKLQCCKYQSVPGLQMHLAPSSCTYTSTIAKFSDWTVSAATLYLSTYMNFVCAEKEPFTSM